MGRGEDARRLRSLDGLRGLAALVVVVHHVVMAGAGSLSAAVMLGIDAPGAGRWLTGTPLAILWAGPEMVIVFFVLSGFVLARGQLARRTAPREFLRRRLVRLYLPAWMSLALGALVIALVPRAHVTSGAQFWLDGGLNHVTAANVLHDAALVLPDPGLNAVLWSLRWEVLFSAALPLVLIAAGPLRRAGAAAAGVVLAAACWGPPAVAYLAPFALGVLLALHEERLAGVRRRLAGRGAPPAVVLVATLLTADAWLPGAQRATGTGGALVAVGATAAVLLPLLYVSVARLFETRVLQWLGARSFSLYLVHLPIVVAWANGLDGPGLAVLAAVAVPSALLTAELFHRLVERPAHRLARGERRSRRRARAGAPAGLPRPEPRAVVTTSRRAGGRSSRGSPRRPGGCARRRRSRRGP